ncbi:MAG TPA: asparagine synthase (glutamine-hydrolyzing) [Gammaproteobacteria bacterium]|nr:asparagine synthase (glutamine-hydrolyzing) [Gammaproteobacteria bacterium]
MCGIAGIFSRDGRLPPTAAELDVMQGALAHRGPDDNGILLSGNTGLAHTRLAIIDPAGGVQPMSDAGRRVHLVFNGEIFNHPELRAALEREGCRFRTRSDTEVVLELYRARGERFLEELNGQFALAVWDERVQRLLLARDRVGIVPLHYTWHGGRLLFASEIKALLPLVPRPEPDVEALDQLMTLWAPVPGRTLFRGMHQLRPGEMISVDRNGMRRRRYWQWDYPDQGDYLAGSPDSLAEELDALLADATRIRLRADVPVAAYLSGGLDSSTLVWLIRRATRAPLSTFSVEFPGSSLDESHHQDALVRTLGLDHRRLALGGDEILGALDQAVWHAESPLFRTAPVPLGLLSGLVRENGYRVVVTGEGADEVLGGYDILKETKVRAFWARQPRSRWRPLLLRRLYPWMNLAGGQSDVYLQRFFGLGLERPEQPFFSHLPRWRSGSRCRVFWSADLRERMREDPHDALAAELPSRFFDYGPFQRAAYLEATHLLPGYLLSTQGDRMLMWHSVEGRFPFLDHRVVDFANRLDPRVKMHVLEEKYLLRRVMRGRIPDAVLRRRKQPYRAPAPAGLAGAGGADLRDDLMSAESIRAAGYFDPVAVGRLLDKMASGRALGHADGLAAAVVLTTQMWHRRFFGDGADHFRRVPSRAVQGIGKAVTGDGG